MEQRAVAAEKLAFISCSSPDSKIKKRMIGCTNYVHFYEDEC